MDPTLDESGIDNVVRGVDSVLSFCEERCEMFEDLKNIFVMLVVGD